MLRFWAERYSFSFTECLMSWTLLRIWFPRSLYWRIFLSMWILFRMVMVLLGFFVVVVVNVLLWTTCQNDRYMLHGLRKPLILPLKGRWCEHISFISLALHAYSSQPVSKVSTHRVLFFLKPYVSTCHCKLKAVFFFCMKLNLNMRFVR